MQSANLFLDNCISTSILYSLKDMPRRDRLLEINGACMSFECVDEPESKRERFRRRISSKSSGAGGGGRSSSRHAQFDFMWPGLKGARARK